MPEETLSFDQIASSADGGIPTTPPAATTTETPKAPPAPPQEAAKETSDNTPAPTEAKPAKEANEKGPLDKLMGKKDKPAEPAKEGEEKAIDWKTAPKEFRERFEKLSLEHKTTAQKAAEFEKRVTDYESKIKEIESKSGDTSKADLKLVEEYTTRINKYEETLQELDYSRSDKFQKEYVQPFTQRYTQAVEQITQLQVTSGQDEDGNATTRPATKSDFDGLTALPFGQQRALARQLFGPDADVVLSHINRLAEIRTDANNAIEAAKTSGDVRTKEQQLANQKQAQEYEGYLKTFQTELETNWPDMFTPPKDDQEGADALKAGYEFVDTAIGKASDMTPQDRAAHTAVLRARAAAYPLLEHRLGKIESERDSLLTELKELRGSDPGKGGAKPAPSAKDDSDSMDFTKASEAFNNM